MLAATDFKAYYALSGVSKTATADDIKLAYRKLARKHHPDVNPGNSEAEDKFKDINETNEVLSNLKTHEKYDQFGNTGSTGRQSALLLEERMPMQQDLTNLATLSIW